MHRTWEEEGSELLDHIERRWRSHYGVHELQRRIVTALQAVKHALQQDSADARLILSAYRRLPRHEIKREELAQANEALRRLLKSLGVAVVGLLPLSFITLPALFALAHRLGIELLPAANSADGGRAPETPGRSRKK